MTALSLSIAMILNYQEELAFEFEKVDKRVIIRTFFKHTFNVEPTIDPETSGKATIMIEKGRFEIQLSHLMEDLRLTYRYQAGTFRIMAKNPV